QLRTPPFGVHAGTPGTRSTQTSSRCSRSVVVLPLVTSTANVSATRWSRLITWISGVAVVQLTRVRYGYEAWSQVTSVRSPSSVTCHSDTSALLAPAAG